MGHIDGRDKRTWFFLAIVYFVIGYLTINRLIQSRAIFIDVSLPVDRRIPFIPLFIFGYILVYASILLIYIIIKDRRDWHRAILSFFLATTVSYFFFIVWPVRMELRPDMAEMSGLSASVTRLYYAIDLPYNCFPSLHITYPTLATFVSWKNHRAMRWAFMTMTAIVAASVLLVKQHYVADVAAGFANAFLCYLISVELEKKWHERGCATPSSV